MIVQRYTDGPPDVVRLLSLALLLYLLRLGGLILLPRAIRTTPLVLYGSLALVFIILGLGVLLVARQNHQFRREVGLVWSGWQLAVVLALGLGILALGLVLFGNARIAPRTLESALPMRVGWGLGVAIGAPLVEEFIFRGLLLAYLLERIPYHFSRWRWPSHYLAIGISALAFALAHLGVNPLFLIVLFGGGLLYGWVRWQSGSLLPSVAGHMAWNGVLMLGQTLHWLNY